MKLTTRTVPELSPGFTQVLFSEGKGVSASRAINFVFVKRGGNLQYLKRGFAASGCDGVFRCVRKN